MYDAGSARDTREESAEVRTVPHELRTVADAQYASYMRDVRRYLQHVRSNRVSFRQLDVYAPRFSQGRDEGLPFRNPRTDQRLEHECGPVHPQRGAVFTVLNWFRGRR